MPNRPQQKQKEQPKTVADMVLMAFAAIVILGTLAGVSYIMMAQNANKHASAKAQMRPLKYPARSSLVEAAGNKPVWAYKAGAVYIILPAEALAADIERSPLLAAVTAPFSDNPNALPGAKIYTASGLEGLRVIDLEKAGRLNTAEIISALCTRTDFESPVCGGYAQQAVIRLRNRLNTVLHHVFYKHLAEGDAAAMSFFSGRASFYRHFTPIKTAIDGKTENAVRLGKHRVSQVKCTDCFLR